MAYRLCRKDIRSEYSKSALGFVWDFLDPLIYGLIFCGMAKIRVIQPGSMGMPYPVFVIYGLLIYQTFSESVTKPMDIIRGSRNLINHLSVPPEALIISSFFRICFNSLFRIAAMLIVSVLLIPTGLEIGMSTLSLTGFLKFLILFPFVILCGMSIGVFLSPFNTVYGDVGRITRIVLTPLRYASQSVFIVPKTGFPFNIVALLNPASPFIENLRSLATMNEFVDPTDLFVKIFLMVLLFILASVIFHLAIPVLAERA